jgi:hypothetical protein
VTSDCKPGDPKECEGIPVCLQTYREVKATCAKIKKDFVNDCLRLTCALIRSLPPPP